MKITQIITVLLVAIMVFSASGLAQDMTKDQWQSEMNRLTTKRNELKGRFDKLTADVNTLKNQSSTLDADIAACEDNLYKLLGMTRDQIDAFERELVGYERRTDELMKMSDADLIKYKDEIMKMSKRVDEMAKTKAGALSRFKNRLSSLRKNIDGLIQTLSKSQIAGMYTVGTWAKDRDCLWNIAKKPATYNNAWMWPKIWQGNKDKISDPDIIQPGWRLAIPGGTELTKEEKSAADSYYRKKARG
jgi:uncharacterized phage infection (PIP) family protein YhgE